MCRFTLLNIVGFLWVFRFPPATQDKRGVVHTGPRERTAYYLPVIDYYDHQFTDQTTKTYSLNAIINLSLFTTFQ